MNELEKEAFPATAAPSINKTPFLVFDGILVVTALLLAITSGGPLSPLLFFWILFCVAAGGVVACLPFWIEFRDRMRLAEYEVRERQSGAGNTQWQYLDARLSEMGELLQKNHLRLADCADRIAQLEARPLAPQAEQLAELSAAVLQQQWPQWRQDLLGSLQSGLATASAQEQEHSQIRDKALREELAELKRGGETLGQSLQEHLGARQIAEQATGESLAGLQERISMLAAAVATLAAAPVAAAVLTPAPQSQDAGTAEVLPAAQTASEAFPAGVEPKIVAEAEATAEAENSLDTEEDAGLENSAEAEYHVELDDDGGYSEADAESQDRPELEETAEQLDAEEPAESDFSAESEPQNAAEDEFTADTDINAGTADSADTLTVAVLEADAPEANAAEDEVTAADEPAQDTFAEAGIGGFVEAIETAEQAAPAESAASVETAEAIEPAKPAVEQPVLLETPEVVVREKKSAASGGKTTLVAQVLIGIGNKPYVRGSGPGLSLEKGVPMQFVEIGKWEWVCPQGSEPVSIQIYKNDEIPCTLGLIDIEAGQRRAVTPVFPK